MPLEQEQGAGHRHHSCIFWGGGLVLALIFAACIAFFSEPFQRNYLYPFPYRDMVDTYAVRYQVDPHLAAAVIKTESKFKNEVHSHRGAVGLMQLMPDTAAWIAGQLDDASYSEDALHEPERNIRYGIWYLHSLQQEFDGNDILALAAYNAGRGNVQDWILEYGWPRDFHDVDAIPYQETREYVKRVLMNERKYRELYP
ncbi:lytic transglycosylase domain-containing protein [Mitsuokella sp.]|uniref:lytic transglycosylase domain-containing protein n=1 Tax=Mitsuokella TaxID=52225 RepID=UPI0029E317D1|nr:lytic transglycosylase domain-containing protein [Mitsuokella sp.]MDD6383475.1 lytic transglycosylase domain-containing protein [Selenomonadaceae bacterium]MDY4474964.1 lytic transglycosylase domain-containing protein [Mitsuokella sp.]